MMMGLQEAALVTGEPCWRFGISNVEDGVRAQLVLSQILGAPHRLCVFRCFATKNH